MAHADTPSLSRLRPRTVSMRTFRRAAVATLVILWLVVATGGLVRLTASGLGCPHWPTCQANALVPPDSSHPLIEFSSRAISGVATAAGPHPGSTTTPIERIGNFYDAAWVHVRVATTFTVLLVALSAWLWRRFRGSPAQRLSVVAVVLLGCQAAVGEYQYRNGLPWEVIAVHVALAATLLITVVLTASLIALPVRARAPDASRAAAR